MRYLAILAAGSPGGSTWATCASAAVIIASEEAPWGSTTASLRNPLVAALAVYGGLLTLTRALVAAAGTVLALLLAARASPAALVVTVVLPAWPVTALLAAAALATALLVPGLTALACKLIEFVKIHDLKHCYVSERILI